MMQPILTVGIPTFGRRDAVAARVAELCALPTSLDIRFLVIDNASPDGTYDHLTASFDDPRLTVRRNEENVGYGGNIVRLAESVETDYLLVTSDEDCVEASGLALLIEHCRTHSPAFVSPRAQVGSNEAYRGLHMTRPARADEFERASFYISGLTFSRAFLRTHVAELRSLIPGNAAATVYPQVILSAIALAADDGWFLDALTTRQVVSKPTTITDPGGSSYYGVAGRWSQFLGYERFFSDRISHSPASAAFEAMRDESRRRVRTKLMTAATTEVPELAPYLQDVSAPPSMLGRARRAAGRILGR